MADPTHEEKVKDFFQSLRPVVEYAVKEDPDFLEKLVQNFKSSGFKTPETLNTPYVNTIPLKDEPPYPGNREIERKIKSYVRWNAMAMVVQANRFHHGIGGHISSYASFATLYEVGFNHFFKGPDHGLGDMVYFQGHSSPGIYARAFLEGRLSANQLHDFRQELTERGGGLPSYPHPYLMPDFWQFPTVSMGLGPISSIYQARFNRYMRDRGLLQGSEPKVWAFVGDGETDEPESLGALSLAGREKLDNLIWVINCNLQRLDGPVRGNGKIIQELEGVFRGCGWNVIKVIWGSDWDPLLEKDHKGLLVRRMTEAIDGDYQKYSVEPGSYTRKHFFGTHPELLALVNHLTDEQIHSLRRGGHDPQKVYAAYKAAVAHTGAPTVILAKTVKGYGLGEAGEGRNITHQQKELSEKELREFRARFDIPVSDEEVAEAPFYRPPYGSEPTKYLMQRREELGGFVPARHVHPQPLEAPGRDYYAEFLKAPSSEVEMSSTMGFVRVLTKLLRHPKIGRQIVPIIPDEARTFGMDSLFRQVGIYSSIGQRYEPVDKESLLYYKESRDGQILEEGITEAGAMASFTAAGTAYASLTKPMIPFFTFYSMFGFQRIGDLIWAAGDIRARGFLLGATAGRTTLNGEGLQHQDGHSQLIATTNPSLLTYDPAYLYEIAVIIEEGIRRMYVENDDVFYYLTLYNENYLMPAMPETPGVREGILKGLYCCKRAESAKPLKVHLFGSGPILREALAAQKILAEQFSVSADVWSVTSYKQLRNECLHTDRWNLLHPTKTPKKSYLQEIMEKEEGPVVAVSDFMKLVPDQIAPWIKGGYFSLGTDGFGRSDTRKSLRRFFEVDAEYIVLTALYALAKQSKIKLDKVEEAMKELKIDPDKAHAICVF